MRSLGPLVRAFRRGRVEQTAGFARALSALVQRPGEQEWLPGGAVPITRAALTARVLSLRGPVPWPGALMRQLDPDDPAYLPSGLAIHPVLAARESSRLGQPGRPGAAWVDAIGWCGVGEGPGLSVWFGDGRQLWPVGRAPGERGAEAPRVEQGRTAEGLGLLTRCEREGFALELLHWPVILQGQVAFAVQARLMNRAPQARLARLAFSLRPANLEGVQPIFSVERSASGVWSTDGRPALALERAGQSFWVGTLEEPDPWTQIERGSPGGVGRVQRRCGAGLCCGAELYREELPPGGELLRLAVLCPPEGADRVLTRTTGAALWAGAAADRQGLLSSGCEVELEEGQPLLEAARLRLLLDVDEGGLPALLGALALSRLGFVRRAGERLGGALSRVRRDGSYPSPDPEEASVLCWAAAEHLRWSGESAWIREHRADWGRLLHHLMEADDAPSGPALFGPEGSSRWTRIWRCAALIRGAGALREVESAHQAWALRGGELRETLLSELGDGPWSAAPDRAPDGSGAAMLLLAWLGLVDIFHPGVSATIEHLRSRCWHGGGVLLGGGAHLAATALLLAVESRRLSARAESTAGTLQPLLALASPTGALPTARHPWRGALGEGDDRLSAALFTFAALDRLQVGRGQLSLLPGLRRARDLPTPYGRVDVDTASDGSRSISGRWRGPSPRLDLGQ